MGCSEPQKGFGSSSPGRRVVGDSAPVAGGEQIMTTSQESPRLPPSPITTRGLPNAPVWGPLTCHRCRAPYLPQVPSPCQAPLPAFLSGKLAEQLRRPWAPSSPCLPGSSCQAYFLLSSSEPPLPQGPRVRRGLRDGRKPLELSPCLLPVEILLTSSPYPKKGGNLEPSRLSYF